MKKLISSIAITMTTMAFCGCDSAPSCDDALIKETLTEIYNENVAQTKKSTLTYEAFITDFKDNKTQKVKCKAKVKFSPKVNGIDGEYISYEAQFTDDSKLYMELESELIQKKRFDDIWKEAEKEADAEIDRLIREEERRNRW